MSSLSVKAPKEDPTIAAARAAEQQRADAAFVSSTQSLEQDELRKRARRLGVRAGLAGTPGAVTGAAGFGGVGSGSQAIPSVDYGSFGEGFGTFGAGGNATGFL